MPWFVASAVCFTVFLLIGLLAPNRFDTIPLVVSVSFLLLSITALMVPLLVDYSADSAEYIQAERARVVEQTQRLQAAAESLARAGAQIKSIEEAVHKSAHAAENLPYRMQEKLAEFNETLAAKDTEDREALERELDELRAANSSQLKAVADKVAKAAADWTALEAAARKQLTAVQEASAKLNDQFKANLAELDTRLASLAKAVAVAGAPSVAMPASHAAASAPTAAEPSVPLAPVEEPKSEALAAPSPIESVTLSETNPASADEAKPKKPRAPRKTKAEDMLAAMSAEAAPESPASAESAESTPAADEATADLPAESPVKAEAASSSDGATRLLVTAYIGIGNKLFIRGDGPGLSWDKGVPMQFVSIGKWGWASHEVTAPVVCKLYKNDETLALSGEIALEPGKHVEVTALF